MPRKNAPPEYKHWINMRYRCRTKNDQHYAKYRKRGITFCERWESFDNFLEDMGPRPTPDHSLGRIDNEGNYEPDNCRWETHVEQNGNRRGLRMITYHDETLCLAEWARKIGVPRHVLRNRLNRGWDLDRAMGSK